LAANIGLVWVAGIVLDYPSKLLAKVFKTSWTNPVILVWGAIPFGQNVRAGRDHELRRTERAMVMIPFRVIRV